MNAENVAYNDAGHDYNVSVYPCDIDSREAAKRISLARDMVALLQRAKNFLAMNGTARVVLVEDCRKLLAALGL